MLYAGGAPILYLFACLSMFLTYWLDKVLILRVYNRGKMDLLDGALAQTFTDLLPWALVFHLAFTIYMYGSDDAMYDSRWGGEGVLVSSSSSGGNNSSSSSTDDASTTGVDGGGGSGGGGGGGFVEAYLSWLNETAAHDPLDILPRLARSNTVALVVLLALVVVFNLLRVSIMALLRNLRVVFCPAYEYRPVHALQKDPARSFDDYTRDVENAFTEDWTIWVLAEHMDDFYAHCTKMGIPENEWWVGGCVRPALLPCVRASVRGRQAGRQALVVVVSLRYGSRTAGVGVLCVRVCAGGWVGARGGLVGWLCAQENCAPSQRATCRGPPQPARRTHRQRLRRLERREQVVGAWNGAVTTPACRSFCVPAAAVAAAAATGCCCCSSCAQPRCAVRGIRRDDDCGEYES